MKPEGERILGSRPHGGKDVSPTSSGIAYRVMGSNQAPEISMRPDTVPGLSPGSDSRPGGNFMLSMCQHDGYADRGSGLIDIVSRFFVRAKRKKTEIPRASGPKSANVRANMRQESRQGPGIPAALTSGIELGHRPDHELVE